VNDFASALDPTTIEFAGVRLLTVGLRGFFVLASMIRSSSHAATSVWQPVRIAAHAADGDDNCLMSADSGSQYVVKAVRGLFVAVDC